MVKKSCTACPLHAFRRHCVYGRGTIPADVLFIGEAPGKSEDLLGQAFIGLSGKLLDSMMQDAEVKHSFYITNCCLCRPCDGKAAPNREPKAEEVLACMPNVVRIINQVKAKKVILLGKIAAKFYGKEFPNALKLVHPAFLIRQGGRASPHYSSAIRALKEYLCQ
jgi:uracil-DNA glycosylase